MKLSTITLMIAVLSISALYAQEINPDKKEIKTIFGNKKISHGGYGGLIFGMDIIDKSYAFHSGLRAAWMIGPSFGLGFTASGFSNDMESLTGNEDEVYNLNGGYGGLLFEPVFAPRFPFHLSFPIVAGAGTVVSTHTYKTDDYEWDAYTVDESFFLMLQPGVEIELNLLKFLRLGAGVSWKFTTETDIPGKDNYMFDHLMYQASLKFGKF